jgi:hypothetical protein
MGVRISIRPESWVLVVLAKITVELEWVSVVLVVVCEAEVAGVEVVVDICVEDVPRIVVVVVEQPINMATSDAKVVTRISAKKALFCLIDFMGVPP